jgi:hypothetical protein
LYVRVPSLLLRHLANLRSRIGGTPAKIFVAKVTANRVGDHGFSLVREYSGKSRHGRDFPGGTFAGSAALFGLALEQQFKLDWETNSCPTISRSLNGIR